MNFYKKMVVLLLCQPLLCSIEGKVIIDKTENGCRMISTESQVVKNGKSDRIPLRYALSAVTIEDETRWSVIITMKSYSPFMIPENSFLKIYLNDGEMIAGIQQLPDEQTTDKTGKCSPGAGRPIYTMVASYQIDEQDLFKMKLAGIEKLNFITSKEEIDVTFKEKNGNELCSVLSSHMNDISLLLTESFTAQKK